MNFKKRFQHQTWWGKILGTFFGFLMAGPVGALFGMLLGHSFDRGLHQHYAKPCWPYRIEPNKKIQETYVNTLFSVLGYLAKIDGRVSERAIQFASTGMNDLGLSRSEKKRAKCAFTEGKQPTFSLQQTLNTFSSSLRHKPQLVNLFLQSVYQMIQNEGLTTNRVNAMNIILKALNLSPLYQQQPFNDFFSHTYSSRQRQQYTSNPSSYNTLSEAYARLNLPSSASQPEVKRAYRRLMSQHHPDKLMAKGYSAAQIKQANEKTQRIRKAYDDICKSKGW